MQLQICRAQIGMRFGSMLFRIGNVAQSRQCGEIVFWEELGTPPCKTEVGLGRTIEQRKKNRSRNKSKDDRAGKDKESFHLEDLITALSRNPWTARQSETSHSPTCL